MATHRLAHSDMQGGILGRISLAGEKPHLSEVEKPFGQDIKHITKSDRTDASFRHT